jgi:hypothetical protein
MCFGELLSCIFCCCDDDTGAGDGYGGGDLNGGYSGGGDANTQNYTPNQQYNGFGGGVPQQYNNSAPQMYNWQPLQDVASIPVG